MPFMRKLPDRETLAAHVAAGMTIGRIAETYNCLPEAVRRKLISLGLIASRSRAVLLAEAREREVAPAPSRKDVLLGADRITFTREFFMAGKGFELRPLSLPRNSMHIAAIASKYPQIRGGLRP